MYRWLRLMCAGRLDSTATRVNSHQHSAAAAAAAAARSTGPRAVAVSLAAAQQSCSRFVRCCPVCLVICGRAFGVHQRRQRSFTVNSIWLDYANHSGYLLVPGTLTLTLALKLTLHPTPKPYAKPKPDLFLNLGPQY